MKRFGLKRKFEWTENFIYLIICIPYQTNYRAKFIFTIATYILHKHGYIFNATKWSVARIYVWLPAFGTGLPAAAPPKSAYLSISSLSVYSLSVGHVFSVCLSISFLSLCLFALRIGTLSIYLSLSICLIYLSINLSNYLSLSIFLTIYLYLSV